MKKTTPTEGATLATLHNEIDRYCRRFGIDHARTFESLLDLMIHFFEWDTQSPQQRESFRNPEAEAELFNLMRIFFSVLRTELDKRGRLVSVVAYFDSPSSSENRQKKE